MNETFCLKSGSCTRLDPQPQFTTKIAQGVRNHLLLQNADFFGGWGGGGGASGWGVGGRETCDRRIN